MKQRTFIMSLVLLSVLFLGTVRSAGGSADDPLISLKYLIGEFQTSVEKSVDQKLDVSDQQLLSDAGAEWNRLLAAAQANVGSEHTATFREAMCKQGDILSGPTGLQAIVLSGSVSVQFASGCVIDVTDGTELSSGAAVPAAHRLLVAEDTTALFTVTSKTAVIDYCGDYHFALSSAPDYNAMALALKQLTLFRGTSTGIAYGFELSRAPSRIEALVMLVRLLGEEDAALATTSPCPFTDIDPWAAPYAAYAFEKGYSNGIGGGLFGSTMSASAQMYTEFLLRALGYSSFAQSDISDAPDRAYASGIITDSERKALQSGEFLRADVAYLSYYALSAPLSGSSISLSDKLMRTGVYTDSDYRSAAALVTTQRLS